MQKINKEYLNIIDFTKKILAIPSPSGFTHKAINFLEEESKKRNLNYEILNTGTFVISIKGETDYTIGLSAHVDTLGAIVSSINANGTLRFDRIGGPILATYDGEYCLVHTRDGKTYQGTFLSDSPAIHVYPDSKSLPRDIDHMHIRLDEVVHNKKDVLDLGIYNGDYISLDPKTVFTESGYLKSRFLDDKLSVGILFGLIDYLQENKLMPKANLKIIFSIHEEVGFGTTYIPTVDELIAVDMGCVGLSLDGSEEKVSICAKDSGGPYNYDITSKLIELAKENKLDYAVDVFPYYSSDVTATLKAGNNIRGGLIGSGVAASHGMERTHIKGIINTFELLKAYVLK